MKRITFFLLALCCAIVTQAQTVVATMQDLVNGAASNTATVSSDWQVDNANGAVYAFDGTASYIGGITSDAVVSALEGNQYVTIAMWVYPETTNGGKCVFGYGGGSDGLKCQVTANCGGISATKKGVVDMPIISDSRISANKWTLIAYTFSGKSSASANTGGRHYLTGTNGTYWSKGDYKLADMINPAAASKKIAIGSGNQGDVREPFKGAIANVTIITSSALMNNADILAKVGNAPTITTAGLRHGIQEKINYITPLIGENPGYYSATTANPAITAAQAALDNASATDAVLQAALDGLNALTINMPKEGVLYQLVSAYPNYQTNQGVKKAMCITSVKINNVDTKVVGWNTLKETDPQFFWRFTPSGAGYTVQNSSDNSYMAAWNENKQPLSETAATITLSSVGSGQFNIKNGGNVMHTEGHNNGNGVSGPIVGWGGDANSCSSWYIVEAEVKTAANITYRVMDGATVLWQNTVEGVIGNAYPAKGFHNNFVSLPETAGTVTADATIDIPVSDVSINLPFGYGATVDAAPVVALDVHGNEAKYPVYTNGGNITVEYIANTNADDYTQGAVKSNAYLWKFVGNPFAGFKLYNVATASYAVQPSDADVQILLGNEGTVFQVYNSVQGSTAQFDKNTAFALKQIDRSYYINHRSTKLQGWTAADGGSSFRAYAANLKEAQYALTMKGDYATLCLPFYSVVPAGVTLYKNTEFEGDVLTLTAVAAGTLLMPDTPYIVGGTKGETYNFTNTTATSTTALKTEGNLVGVLADGGAAIPAGSYALAVNKNTGKQAFFVTDGTVNCPKNKCYLTVPASAGSARAFYFPGDEATSIESIFGADENSTVSIYNLDGQKLNRLQKGVNIVNGRKVVVK